MQAVIERAKDRRPLIAIAGAVALALSLAVPPQAVHAQEEPLSPRGIDRVCPPDDPDPDAPELTDVSGSTHEAAIGCALDYGLVTGFADMTYRPLTNISRGQMSTIVANWIETATGEELDAPAEDAFPDIATNTHRVGINKLAAAGVVAGRADGNFDPGADITRGQMARFLTGAIDVADTGETDGSLPEPDDTEYFDDVVGTTFQAEIQAIAGLGIAVGTGEGTYRPNAAVTRGQLATFAMHGADYLDREQRWLPTAVTVTYEVTLSSENEVSVDEDTGEVTFGVGETGATGLATLEIDAFAGTIDYTLEYGEVTGPFAGGPGAHIHVGELDENGDIVVGLATGAELDAGGGTITDTVTEDVEDFRYADLVEMPASYYVNVHSDMFQAGAIRGQLPDGGQDLIPSIATFEVTLTGENEVSVDNGTVTEGVGEIGATATATVTVDALRGTVEYSIDYSDVTGPFGDAPGFHIHDGGPAENGPIVVFLADGAEVEAGSGQLEGTFSGDADVDLNQLINDPSGYYLNLHSNDYPAGAVRGQLG